MAEDFLTNFTLTPSDEQTLSGSEQLDAVLGPTVIPVPSTTPEPYGQSWEFDFAQGRFIRQGTVPKPTYNETTLRQWVQMALLTVRFDHPIFDADFGIDRIDVIGNDFRPELLAALATAIEESLLAHDRILRVTDIVFTRDDLDDDALGVELTVHTNTGSTTMTGLQVNG